jgi:hypothetical protein
MTQTISVKEVEAKAFRATVQDGLWDVLVGCFPLQFAVGVYLAPSLGDFWASAVFVPFWLLVYIAIRVVRKHVVAPRVGVMKFGAARKAKLIKVNLLAFVVLVAAMISGLLTSLYFDVMSGWIINLVFGLNILVLFGIGAYYLEFPHLYIYGALLALSPLVGEWLWVNMNVPHHGYPVTFGATAAIIILAGLVKFVRLLRENPVPVAVSSSEEG